MEELTEDQKLIAAFTTIRALLNQLTLGDQRALLNLCSSKVEAQEQAVRMLQYSAMTGSATPVKASL